MKLLKKVSKCLKPKNLYKILLAILLVLLLFLLVKQLMKSREGLEGQNNQKTLLLCHMNGCGHCDKLMPDWDKFARGNKTDILTKKVEVGDDPSYAKKYKVEGFPTILLLGSNGEKLDTYEGPRTLSGLKSYAESN